MDGEILSSRPAQEYTYPPLQGPNSVRLLKLHPAASYEIPIRISLNEVSLDASPEFGALSYTWATENGDCSLSKHAECDGSIIKITVNCDAALRRLRKVQSAIDIWVDAICINQSSDEEKSHQIPLMHQIFSKAVWVALWIGEACSTLDEETSKPLTDLGIEFLSNFAIELQERKDSGQNPRDGILYQEVIKERKLFQQHGASAFSPSVRGLWEILHRSWWKRLWVVQEVSLARSAFLMCGSKSVTFDKVEVVINGLVRKYPGTLSDEHEFCVEFITSTFPQFLMRDFVERTQLQSDYTFLNSGPGQKAFQILDKTRNLRATDPRDKIYGILSFFGDPQSDPENIFPAPDYSKSAVDLYADVARAIIIKTNQLDVLTTCYGFVRTIPDLPSWAPSWNHTPLAYFSEADFKAANDSQVMYQASEDRRSLLLKGKRVDVVKYIPESPDELEYNELECSRLWRQWTDLAFSLQSYPTGQSIADVLLQTLCWDNNIFFKRLTSGEYRENFEAWLKILQSSNPIETVAKDLYDDEVAYLYTHRAQYLIWARALCTTVNLHLALVSITAEADDLIVIFSGGKIPFVLRATDDSTFKIVGPCYVHGIMDGEAFPKEGAEEDLEWFTLR